jgi:uncharacterized protein YihD (DUF1040 family)
LKLSIPYYSNDTDLLLLQVLKRMGLGLGLENGNVTQENLAKAKEMVPRALQEYVIQLAANGPGGNASLPRVTDPIIFKQEPMSSNIIKGEQQEYDSDVDINT